jgi:PIN domain nuclease of toxin-antitoxin system
VSAGAVLLDTHVLVWLTASPGRIPPDTLSLLAADSTTILVSAASAWEMATKFRLGKMPQAAGFLSNWGEAMSELRADEIPISRDDALRGGALHWAHRDPFDRILAAQSIGLNAPLVTGDAIMSGLPELTVLW